MVRNTGFSCCTDLLMRRNSEWHFHETRFRTVSSWVLSRTGRLDYWRNTGSLLIPVYILERRFVKESVLVRRIWLMTFLSPSVFLPFSNNCTKSCYFTNTFLTLILFQFVVIASTLTASRLKYDDYTFPYWSNILGWGLAMSSMLCVPLYALYKFLSIPGTIKEVSIT